MFAKERQNAISEMLRKNGAVTTAHLMEAFGVSIETVRRDLLCMEQQGFLTRVHGGAVKKGDMKPFAELKKRNLEYGKQKRSLALKAAECIADGDIIGVDAGSTAIAFAEVLKERFSKLTVITYSMDVFRMLCDHADFSVILCGGQYMRSENCFYGPMVLDMLQKLYMQKVFIFPTAVSLKYGIYDYQSDFCAVQKQMLQSSDEVYVLADSSKFEKRALLKLDDMKPEYTYATDSELSVELRRLYSENERKILIGEDQK